MAAILGLAVAPPAGATEVSLETGGTAYLYVDDFLGVPDDLRLGLTADGLALQVTGTAPTPR